MNRFQPAYNSWLAAPAHQQWLTAEAARLADFAKASRLAEGFGPLDDSGQLADTTAQTLITTRMTHSFALMHLKGVPGYAGYIDHGIAALEGCLQDPEHGGWYSTANMARDEGKAAYLHAFVALAASSAVAAARPGATELLAKAIRIIEKHFWSETEGAIREAFDRAWANEEAYRGANSNMHTVEAFLALADVTGEVKWLERAVRICARVIHQHAASNGHRVIEHFSPGWAPALDYNHDQPADPFRPYGSTPGHAFEWARLLLHLEAALSLRNLDAPAWLLADARALFAKACHTAWHVDGAPGLVYTLDWNDQPVVRQRMHWVHAEASSAAAALLQRTGESEYEQWYRTFWEFSATYLLDTIKGSWHHELDAYNRPSAQVWGGKPDLYHALQAVLLPTLPLARSLATGVGEPVVTKL